METLALDLNRNWFTGHELQLCYGQCVLGLFCDEMLCCHIYFIELALSMSENNYYTSHNDLYHHLKVGAYANTAS